jgi:hypothetical protein
LWKRFKIVVSEICTSMTVRTYHKRYPFPVIVFAILPLVFLLFTSQPAYSGNEEPETQNTVDTLDIKKTISPIEERLLDPEFDVRIPRGSRLQPWHDRNSMYPRRTLPLNQMAIQQRKQADLFPVYHI